MFGFLHRPHSLDVKFTHLNILTHRPQGGGLPSPG